MPIEEVLVTADDNTNIASKLLEREEFWIKEIGSICPYGLNDNIRSLGNISKKLGQGLVVYSLFNKQARKYRKRTGKRRKNKTYNTLVTEQAKNHLLSYMSTKFSNNIRSYLQGLPRRKLHDVLVW